jgi:DNA-binding NarL/FixJ family response regulator
MNEVVKIKVAVVEDDSRLRRVMGDVFASASDCECIALFSNGAKAAAQLPALRPDVIIMDINLKEESGVDCVRQVSPQLPECRILMLTVYQDTEMIFQAMAAGAHGYLVKPVMPDELLNAVRTIREGGVPMSPSIARKIIDAFLHPVAVGTAKSTSVADTDLPPREKQVLEHVVNGLSQKEIATELGIGVSTVNTYIQRIYEKLHVRSRRGLMALYKGKGDAVQ